MTQPLDDNFENTLRTLARSSPAGLGIAATAELAPSQRYYVPRHIKYLDDAIIDMVVHDKWDAILCSMPPRHGKSWTNSVYTPMWFRGMYPEKSFAQIGYEANFAEEFSSRVRDLANEVGERFFDVKLRQDTRARRLWKLEGYPGIYSATGVGGPLTGRGFHFMNLDDVLKDAKNALSNVVLLNQWNWWCSTASTRLEPGGKLMITMTRWHMADLYGRLADTLPAAGRRVLTINFPGIAEKGCVLGRKPGEALWPERYDVDWFESKRKEVGSYWFNAMYQGRPSPEEGGIFKRAWFQVRPDTRRIDYDFTVISVDATFKDTSDGSYVVGQVWGVSGVQRHLLDQVRDRMDFVDTCTMIKRLYSKWRPDATLIEDKANGPAVISQLKDTIPGMVPISPDGSKEARAHAASPVVEAGNVYLPESVPWVGDFVEECCAFPNAMYDDQVDAMTQAINYLKKFEGAVAPKIKDRGNDGPDSFGPRRRPRMR